MRKKREKRRSAPASDSPDRDLAVAQLRVPTRDRRGSVLPTILITGAAGNLGSLLARHLLPSGHELRLMYHRTPLPVDLLAASNVRAVKADLADPSTLPAAVDGAGVVVHFAGRLFAPRPETFLPETNTRWFSNLADGGDRRRMSQRIILTSFPQVEGPTSFEQPATGRLDRQPISVHARTRLGRGTIAVRTHEAVGNHAGRAAAGDDLRARHSDGRRRALAGAPAPALCVARADVASAAVGARLPAAAEAAIVKPAFMVSITSATSSPSPSSTFSTKHAARGTIRRHCACRIRSSTPLHVCAKASRQSRASPRRSRATSCGWGECRIGVIPGARERNWFGTWSTRRSRLGSRRCDCTTHEQNASLPRAHEDTGRQSIRPRQRRARPRPEAGLATADAGAGAGGRQARTAAVAHQHDAGRQRRFLSVPAR